MATVNEYLKKLLYQYDCVVVPELGAFLTHYQPASFTETSGLYLPPRKRVAFNEALQFDDGILVNYIMLHEPLTREGAQRHIGQFVGELRQQLETVGRFELDGIGMFTVNDEKRLQFDPGFRHNFYGEAYGMSWVSAQLVDRKAEPVIDAVPLTATGPVLVQEADATLSPYRPSRTYWRAAAIALLVGSFGAFSYFSVLNTDQPFQSSLSPANLMRIPSSLMSRFTQPANEVKPELPKAVPIPIKAKKAVVEALPTAASAESPVEAVPAPITPAIEVTPMPETAATTEAVGNPGRKEPYYTVIAGSFTSKQNALRLKYQLRKAGYADAFIIIPPKKGQLYKVAAAGSADRSEAIASMSAIDQLAGTESWIFKN